MYEAAEAACRETQYGVRTKDGIQPVLIGPAEAERYRASGVDIHQRERTTYYDEVSEWSAIPAPADRAPGTAEGGGGRG
jgi:hypothetical protein